METSTEIETKILNSFEQMIDNLTSEKDLDDQVNISNIQSAVDNILNEINGDPRNGFIKNNMVSEKENNSFETGNIVSEKDTPIANSSHTLQQQSNMESENDDKSLGKDDEVLVKGTFTELFENATFSLLPNNTLQNEQFHIDLLPNETFPGTLKLNSHGKLDVM